MKKLRRRPECCPKCGRPLPGIQIGGYVRQRIVDVIARNPGIDIHRLADAVYGVHNGGPENAFTCIHVTICKANKILKQHGLKIVCGRGRGALYRMVTI